jgi:hypothetical protein
MSYNLHWDFFSMSFSISVLEFKMKFKFKIFTIHLEDKRVHGKQYIDWTICN